jgi:hypothetical protein
MKFAQRVFLIAGIYGILVVTPMYFSEAHLGRDFPPEITHPEFFYGFVGVTLAWQILFFVVSRNPIHLRPVMAVAVLEKISYTIAATILYSQGRIDQVFLAGGVVDFVLGVLFVMAYLKTPEG